MNSMTPDELKNRFPALGAVDDDSLDLLLGAASRICPGAGETLIASGAHSETMYLICAGSVRVSLDAPDECAILGDFGPGQWIGEMGMIQPAHAAASVVTLEDCVLLALSHDGFMGLRRHSPMLTSVLLQMLCRDLSARLYATVGFIDSNKAAGDDAAATVSPQNLIEVAKNLLGIAARTGT